MPTCYLRKVDAEGWKDAIVTKNVFRTRNPATTRCLTKLIRGRLESMLNNLQPVMGKCATRDVLLRPILAPRLNQPVDTAIQSILAKFPHTGVTCEKHSK